MSAAGSLAGSLLTPGFYKRDLITPVYWPGNARFRVNSLEWAAQGGPSAASITVFGDELDLWEMLEWLRYKVVITDEKADAVWWGYVSEARVRVDALEIGVTIDSMVNAVAVAYSYVAAGSQVVGERRTTAWVTDTDSIAEFGRKDFLSSQDGMSDASATARRDAILAARRWPQGVAGQQGGMPRGRVVYSGAKKSLSATLYLRGWWDTLRWRMASVSGTASTATTTQISDLVTAYGALLAGTRIVTASGISSSQYRDGDSDVLTEILGLLQSGGPNSRRMLATVDQDRYLVVNEEPASTDVDYVMDSTGRINNLYWASPSEEYMPPVGKWIRLKDVIPSNVDTSKLVSPDLQFVEGATWSEEEGVKLSFRGQPSIEEMGKVAR